MGEHIRIRDLIVLSPAERVIPNAFPPGQKLSIRKAVFCDIDLLFERRAISNQNVPLFDTLDELAYDVGKLVDGAEWEVCIMTEAVFFGKADRGRIDAYLLRPGSFDENLAFENRLGSWDREAVLAELNEKKKYYDGLFANVA